MSAPLAPSDLFEGEGRTAILTPAHGAHPPNQLTPAPKSRNERATKARPASRKSSKAAPPKPEDKSRTRFQMPTAARRLGSAAVDGALIVGLMVMLSRMGAFGEATANLNIWEPDDVGTHLVQGNLTFALVTFFMFVLLYSTLTHGYLGWSLGKRIFGLRVVTSRTGARPSPRRALIRALLSIPSLVLGCAGYLWPIVSRHATCLHDLLSWTRVVRRA